MADITTEDALTMVRITAGAMQETGRGYEQVEQIIERASAILCFIFKLAKPPAYVEGMERVRARYAGIAEIPGAQVSFRGNIRRIAQAGHLVTLSAAIEGEIYRDGWWRD